MDLVGPYQESKKENQYALTVICMLTNYVFMISIKSKTAEHFSNEEENSPVINLLG